MKKNLGCGGNMEEGGEGLRDFHPKGRGKEQWSEMLDRKSNNQTKPTVRIEQKNSEKERGHVKSEKMGMWGSFNRQGRGGERPW